MEWSRMLRFSVMNILLAVGIGIGGILLGSGSSGAAVIGYASGDGLNESNNITGTNVVITPHAAWGDVGGGASWISHTNTGVGGTVAANVASRTRGAATSVFTETLGYINGFSLNVLADDTAAVDLVNVDTTLVTTILFDPFLAQIDPCAPGNSGGVVGCTAASIGIVAFTALTPGTYRLVVYGMQTNNDVYGVQYSGTVNTVPEPTALGLLGLGLVALGFIARGRRRPSATMV